MHSRTGCWPAGGVGLDKGRRTLKYHQLLSEVLESQRRGEGAGDRAAAARCAAPRRAEDPYRSAARLRRPRRGREVLADLAARPEPLVRELPRQRGQHDNRWLHLLGDVPVAESLVAEAASQVDREAVLAAGAEARDQRVRSSYDAVARGCADHLADGLLAPAVRTLAARPDRRARRRRPGGRGRLRSRSRPGLPRRCGCRRVRHRSLAGHGRGGAAAVPGRGLPGRRPAPADAADVCAGWTAVLSWHSLIDRAASELPHALAALAWPLLPGGWLVVGLHTGASIRHLDECFDAPLHLHLLLHDLVEVVHSLLEDAGMTDVEWSTGRPSPRGDISEPLYVVGRKPT